VVDTSDDQSLTLTLTLIAYDVVGTSDDQSSFFYCEEHQPGSKNTLNPSSESFTGIDTVESFTGIDTVESSERSRLMLQGEMTAVEVSGYMPTDKEAYKPKNSSEICDICSQEIFENALICVNCKKAAHHTCYGYASIENISNWCCDFCTEKPTKISKEEDCGDLCELCLTDISSHLALRCEGHTVTSYYETVFTFLDDTMSLHHSGGGWSHLLCGIYTPNVQVDGMAQDGVSTPRF